MKLRKFLLTLPALLAMLTLPACAPAAQPEERQEEQYTEQTEQPQQSEELPIELPTEQPEEPPVEQPEEQPEEPAVQPEEGPVEQPARQQAQYISVNASGVNIRAGASTSNKILGQAEKGTLYISYGKQNGWYKTAYKGVEAYICADYCTPVHMDTCSDVTERVIEEGCRLLGTEYVYGAVRYHNGAGKLLADFDVKKFDCSSLMQYIFKVGADVNLELTTRTQISQGSAVEWKDIERGDLLFFTNASRKDKSGIERVGHVALYLGDNYILHTASDYAKIEKLTPARRGYFIQARRIISL